MPPVTWAQTDRRFRRPFPNTKLTIVTLPYLAPPGQNIPPNIALSGRAEEMFDLQCNMVASGV